MKQTLLLPALSFLISLSATAEEWHVQTPEELLKATRNAAPGDVVIIASGEWKESVLRIHGQGTEEKPILIRAEESGAVKLTGASRLRLSGEYLEVRGLWFHNLSGSGADPIEFRFDSKNPALHCRLSHCAVTQDPDFIPKEKENRWVGIYGHGNKIEHCYFAGKTTKGATVVVWMEQEGAGRHHFFRNYFGPRSQLGGNGGETLRIGDSDTSLKIANCLVEENLFEECDGETECISNKSCENIYRGNVFLEVSGTLTLRHGNDCLVENNVFLGNGKKRTGGVRVIGEGHTVTGNHFQGLRGDGFRTALALINGIPESPLNGYHAVKNVTVSDNTFVDCKYNWLLGYNDVREATIAPMDITFTNNSIRSESGEAAVISDPGLKNITWAGNRIAAPKPGIEEQAGIELVSPDSLEIDAPAPIDRGAFGPDWWTSR